MVPALDALSDVRKGVLTNGDPDQQRGKLRALGLAGHFEAVVVSADVGASKPDPAIFRAACAAVRLAPASCVHVGDSLDADARCYGGGHAGRLVGQAAVGTRWDMVTRKRSARSA